MGSGGARRAACVDVVTQRRDVVWPRRMLPTDLPVQEVVGGVLEGLDNGREVVLAAPPGAGNTTLVLLGAGWRHDGRILVLEPRRLAARAAAHRMASLLGEEAGETVGYRIRMEHRVGPGTRIEVITEGILTRMIQADPGLSATACVIFDEFHERSLHADLALALVQDVRSALRPDRLLGRRGARPGRPAPGGIRPHPHTGSR